MPSSAFLESSRGGTLADLHPLSEIRTRTTAMVLTTVGDPHVAYYWKRSCHSWPAAPKKYHPHPASMRFLRSHRPVRYVVLAAQQNRLDFAQIMDTKKIFLAKLAQGAIGEENAYLLGCPLSHSASGIHDGR